MGGELLHEFVRLSNIPARDGSVFADRSEGIAVEGIELDIADTLRADKRKPAAICIPEVEQLE